MATLGELKARIILEVDRDDLGSGGEAEAALTTAIARATEFYSDQAFWFNRQDGEAITSAGVATVGVPAAIRIPDSVSYLGERLCKVPLADIEARTASGTPSHWAGDDGLIRLWPIPDGTYALTVAGIAQIDTPTLDGQGTAWMDEAYDLIAARAKVFLHRMFKDFDAMQAAQAEEAEALARLRAESRRRSASPPRTDLPPGRATFSVLRGY